MTDESCPSHLVSFPFKSFHDMGLSFPNFSQPGTEASFSDIDDEIYIRYNIY